MFWVAFKGYNSGKAISLGTVEQAEAEAFGMHGYPTEKQAEAKPNTVNAVDKVQVNAWIVATNDITGNPVKDAQHAVKAAAGAVGNATGITGLYDDIEGFLGGVTSRNLWIRVAKVVIGGVLLIVGVAKLTGFDKGIAGAAVKAAPLL